MYIDQHLSGSPSLDTLVMLLPPTLLEEMVKFRTRNGSIPMVLYRTIFLV